VPQRYFNAAGNIANFNMRLFLMLSYKEFEEMVECTEYQRERTATLKSVARDPIQEKLTIFAPDRLAYIRDEEIRRAKYLAELQEEIATKKGTKKIKSDYDFWESLDGLESLDIAPAEE
jgi:hypothetical protein